MLETVTLLALKVLFMYGAMEEGEILFLLRRFLEWVISYTPVNWQFYLRKPLFECIFCMSSVWGLFFYFMPLPGWLSVILSMAGLVYLFRTVINYFRYD